MPAEHPGNVKFKYKKYYFVRKLVCKNISEQSRFDFAIQYMSNILMQGDTQPALVQSVSPLIVSAYSDEMDAVVFLRFPDELVEAYGLTPGMRLVTSTGYERLKDKVAPDIFPESDFSGLYGDFIPIVQLFLAGKKQILFSGGDQEIRERPAIFSEEIWQKVEKKTAEYAGRGLCRDGFFFVKEK